MSQPFDLEETITALGLGEVVGRRNYEAYRAWAKLERDWLTADELEHLRRAALYARTYNRSLTDAMKSTRDAKTDSEPDAASEPARLSEMARELRALQTVSEGARRQQDALIARLKTEDAYYAAWETRLRRSEEELLALWNLLDEVIRLSSASVPRLEKLERRVGYGLRQVTAATQPSKRKPR